MTYNVVLFTDIPNPDHFTRGYGAYRLASEIRKHGYTVLTVDFSSCINDELFTEIIQNSVGLDTICVGFSTTWFPYRKREMMSKYIIGSRAISIDPNSDFDPLSQSWYTDSIVYKISCNGLDPYIDTIKSVNSKCKVIVGGSKASDYVTENVDNVFIGYSENQIIDYLGKKRIFNKVVDYDPKSIIGSFDFNSSKTLYVESDMVMSDELMTFEFSRGCIFNCTFCSFAHRNSDTRDFVKYKDTIYNELMENYTKWGIYKYTITDDTFNDYTEKLVLINEVIQSLPFKPIFTWAYARMDLITKNPEQAELMKNIGIKSVYYGLETFNDTTAKVIRKGGKRERKIEGLRIAKECWGNDIMIYAGIVIGLPYDTVDSVKESVEWYKSEGHKVLDNLKYVDLDIMPDDGFNQYRFLSDIDKDLDKYGYSFPDNTKPYSWVRNNGDINSREHAIRLMNYANSETKRYSNPMQHNEWEFHKDFVDMGSSGDSYYKYVTTHYFPKLLNYLRKD